MSELLEAVRAQNPDVVLFGGDMFDSRRMPDDNAVTLMKALGSEFLCYFVSGNHEVRHGKLDYYKEIAASCGVKVLDGTHTKMAVSAISGTPDIYGFDDTIAYDDFSEQRAHIEQIAGNFHFENSFNVLLIHRPEHFEHYAELGFDLVLCGHAHGGQWRIPGILNGLYCPGEGIFPKYAGGLYEKDGTAMIVSRGLAKESNPVPRIFNRPELVIIDIT
jgi:predicted MPP superfamily phosphohydrolase